MKWKIIFFVLAVCLLQDAFASNVFKKIFESLHHEPPPPEPKYRNNIKTDWINQKIDNFNEADTRTWNMRYMSNDFYFKENGPIFIFVGGEWEISDGYLRGGHMFDMARSLSGYMFYTEHRFYGKSFPIPNLSTSSLQYLSVDQALADLAHFIRTVKATIPGLKNSKVILTGGSYSATMVIWFSRKYPDLVDGAWGSSAPLFAKPDFVEYKEICGESIKTVGGKECHDRIERAIKLLETNVANHDIKSFSRSLDICPSFDTKNKHDVWTLFSSISDLFAGVVQGHTTGSIENMCTKIMSEKDDLAGLGKWVHSYVGGRGCIDFTYKAEVNYLKQERAGNNDMMRQWYYQTCNEFGWYQTSGSKAQPFGSSFPVQLYTDMCAEVYGTQFSAENILKNTEAVNQKYGGWDPDVKNVYFTQGSLDPWRAMGVQANNDNAAVITLYAHCKDLASKSSRDSLEMMAAKDKATRLVNQWLGVKQE